MKATKDEVLKYLHEKLALNQEADTWEVMTYIKLKLNIGNDMLQKWQSRLRDEGHISRTVTKLDKIKRIK